MTDRFSYRSIRFVLFVLLLLLGIQIWLVVGNGIWPSDRQFQAFALAVALMAVPFVSRHVGDALDRLRGPSRRSRWIAACAVGAAAALYLWFTAWRQGRPFELGYHDELAYRLQTTMLAHGRLWMPALPLPDFFDTFYVFTQPKYAAQSFPGSAILFAPWVWFHAPFWLASVMISGASVGMIYWILAELVDGASALCVVLLTLATVEFRRVGIMNLSQPPSLFLGLLALVMFLNWRRKRHIAWLVALGAAVAWHAITRPLDAFCFDVPIAVAVLIELRRERFVRDLTKAGLWLFVGAAPFLVVQLVFNVGVTGHWWQTPLSYYNDREQPGVGYGFREFDPHAQAPSHLAQKRELYDIWIRDALRTHTLRNMIENWPRKMVPNVVAAILPTVLLLVLIPIALLAPRFRPALLFMGSLLAIALYAGHPVFGIHYMFISIPAAACLAVLGATMIAARWRWAGNALLVGLAALAVGSAPELNHRIDDQRFFRFYELESIEQKLRGLPQEPAIVLFHFDAQKDRPEEEPVYNTEVCWPDDARIVRAHDLGARNHELFEYYAARQPNRNVYLYDRGDDTIRLLGKVSALGHQ